MSEKAENAGEQGIGGDLWIIWGHMNNTFID
jgi:hypothetical protein